MRDLIRHIDWPMALVNILWYFILVFAGEMLGFWLAKGHPL